MSLQHIIDMNSCGIGNDHTAEWRVSLTSPEGRTGIEVTTCEACLVHLLRTPAVKASGRVASVRAV